MQGRMILRLKFSPGAILFSCVLQRTLQLPIEVKYISVIKNIILGAYDTTKHHLILIVAFYVI